MSSFSETEIVQQIDAYIRGELSEEEAEKLWIHLIQHPEHMELLETELAARAALTNTTGSFKIRFMGRPFSGSNGWFMAAACVVLVIVSLLFFRIETDSELKRYSLQTISPTEGLETPDVFRAESDNPSTVDSLLSAAYQKALKGDVEEAKNNYEQVIHQHEDPAKAADAHLNLGILHFNFEDYEDASESFQKALDIEQDDEIQRERTWWYLGNAYLNMGDLDKAREAVLKAYNHKGMYQKPSLHLLRSLDYQSGTDEDDPADNLRQ